MKKVKGNQNPSSISRKVVNEKTDDDQVQGDNPKNQQGGDETTVAAADPIEGRNIDGAENNARDDYNGESPSCH